jgi:hypothetical protein
MTQGAILQLEFLHLGLVHLVLASLATVVIPCDYGLARDHTRREVTAATATDGIVFTDRLLAVSARTLDLLPRSLLRRVLGKDTHSDIGIALSLLWSPQAL